MQKKIISVKNIIWMLLLITCIGTLYSGTIVMLLPVVVCIYTTYNLKMEKGVIGKGILLLINYLPFYTVIRVGLIYLGMESFSGMLNYFRDFVIIVLLCFCLRRNGLRLFKEDAVWIFFVINWVIGLVIAGINGYFQLGISGLHLSVIPMFLYYVIVYGNSKIDVENVINQFFRIAIIIAIVGLWAYIRRPEVYCELFDVAGNATFASTYVRFVSVFFTPNVCGCFFAISVVIALVQFIYKKRMVYFLLTSLFLPCLVLTMSRGAWMFALGAILVLFCFIKPKFGIPLLCIASFTIFCMVLAGRNYSSKSKVMFSVIYDRIVTIFDFSNNSSYGRITVGLDYIKLLLNNPFGFGLGIATTAQMSYGTLFGVSVIDGFYLKSIVETGVIGICYIVMFILWLVKRSFYACRTYRNEIGIISFLLAIGFLLQSIGSNTFDFVCTAPMLWIFLGLSVKTSIEMKSYVEENHQI